MILIVNIENNFVYKLDTIDDYRAFLISESSIIIDVMGIDYYEDALLVENSSIRPFIIQDIITRSNTFLFINTDKINTIQNTSEVYKIVLEDLSKNIQKRIDEHKKVSIEDLEDRLERCKSFIKDIK